MATEEPRDPLERMTWKNVYKLATTKSTDQAGQAGKKRLPRKIREIPEHYFLPRYSWPKTLAFSGACIAAGIGTGMLIEIWMNKKIEKDGGIIWEFDK